MAEKRWRVALVGAGFFAPFQLRGWLDAPGVQVVGICDRDAARAQALAGNFGVPAVFGDLQEMLSRTQVDLVDLATPPASHAALLTETLARGIPTICQKPFCGSYAEALAITGKFEKAGVPLVVHENFRFTPWFREARRLLDEGLLGTPHGVSFRLRPGDGQGPAAYLDRQPYFQQMPRLLVAETGVHFIDAFRYLLGDVVHVSAILRRLNPVIRGEDSALVALDFAHQAVGLLDANRLNDHVAANPRRTMGEMWLEGEGGVLRLDGDARMWWKPHHGDEREHAYDSGPVDQFGGGACGNLQRHVLESLGAGRTPENTARAYLENLRVQEAVYESHRLGRRVEMAGFEPPVIPRAPFAH